MLSKLIYKDIISSNYYKVLVGFDQLISSQAREGQIMMMDLGSLQKDLGNIKLDLREGFLTFSS